MSGDHDDEHDQLWLINDGDNVEGNDFMIH
jgi:hypothetical protein